MNFNMLAAPTLRSKIYLHYLIRQKFSPTHVIILNTTGKHSEKIIENCEFDLSISVEDLCKKHHIRYKKTDASNPNDKEVIELIKKQNEEIFIYSGPSGVILKEEILKTSKKFLHAHAGWLPKYRGSTTIYYSLLKENTCGVSVFFLDKGIDTGPILKKQYFKPPKRTENLNLYDINIRAKLLCGVLKTSTPSSIYETQKQVENQNSETYYIIHPVLKHIAILSLK